MPGPFVEVENPCATCGHPEAVHNPSGCGAITLEGHPTEYAPCRCRGYRPRGEATIDPAPDERDDRRATLAAELIDAESAAEAVAGRIREGEDALKKLRRIGDIVCADAEDDTVEIGREKLNALINEIERAFAREGLYTSEEMAPGDKSCMICELSSRLQKRLFGEAPDD